MPHQQQHFGTDVLGGVVGWNRKVALLQLDLVGKVAAFFDATAIPRGLNRVNAVEATTFTRVVTDVVKDEKLWLRAEKGCIG